MKIINKDYQVIVVGGGMTGVSAALAAARHGKNTALIQNRPVLGGNASSEIRVNINGAARHGKFANFIETGIINEIQHATKAVNPQYSFNIADIVLWEKCTLQPNLDLYLNTHVSSATVLDNRVKAVYAVCNTNETEYNFKGDIFIDATGDGMLAAMVGADYTIGRESKATYNEKSAPDIADHHTMGSTVMFTTIDCGKPTPFKRPDWAYEVTKEKLGARSFGNINHGYWWVEVGGDDLAVIEDNEEIRDELYRWAFGVFDYMKNSGNLAPELVENLALDWVCAIPGKRESRRVYGDYVLNENDCYEGKRKEDAIAYGGWSLDAHSVGGIRATGEQEEGTVWGQIKAPYDIPYRCIYSRNIENLFVGGRAISCSHMAMSSTRVIATCAITGEAAGVAASMCLDKDILPRALGEKHIVELQETLLRDDMYIPYRKSEEKTLAHTASISASSSLDNAEPHKVINGFARNTGEENNAWISEKIVDVQWLKLSFDKTTKLKELHIKFDCDLSSTLMTTLVIQRQKKQPKELPLVLVRDFKVEFISNGTVVETIEEMDNIYRFKKYAINTECDTIKISVSKTYGDEHARIFEVRVY